MSHKFSNLFLIGPMGCGKNTIGKQLAQLTQSQFYDSDYEIELRSGVSISWIFAQETESGFRRREKEMIQELVKKKHIVLATGGGAVITPENQIALRENGVVIYLTVSLETQIKRISLQKSKRPLFTTKEELDQLNKKREPIYKSLADLTYNTDHISPRQLAIQIMADWKQLYS